jgi:hypothetical protein
MPLLVSGRNPMASSRPDVTHPVLTERMDDDRRSWAAHKFEYSDMCPLCGPRIERNKRITAFHRSFIEFGYTALTRDETTLAYDLAMSREPTAADGIIARLIRSQLVEAGIVE